ncbi:SDR family NAD(P)-dependent oxidoreductase [Robiginitalea aurantiaca]|uniref:SDR family NAD(P)-dependent oxidoreductase n=1 Tax=Robiginitalea aurantiaca TaxID=3056915 RepID=A0ABT7WH50_9FLAO|nr:SDR family NAD(P)-dependent oxidoreductase [Robiginitalea aurantiaca]MDM9632246.1 SDR family NAD(P)-dependent oxidoreductase [Robiginitalea aurantiaca]
MESKHEYALITGASLGIGREIAKEFAQRKINTLLVALDTPELYQIQKDLREDFHIRAETYPADLTDPACAIAIHQWCKENDFVVKYLINNAGIGESGFLEDIALKRYCQMIDLNTKAYIALTHQFLPDLKKLGEAYIMNTSSMEATLPLPYKAVYTGTKNFIYAFSLALNQEVRRYGVRVSVLCPGPVLTNEEGLKRIEAQGKKARMMMLYPDQVASYAIKNLLGGRLVINPGRMNRWINRLQRLIPMHLKMRILEQMFRSYTRVSPSK